MTSDGRVHLELLGAHTRVIASLCAACPRGETGCCDAPPDLSWTDTARIASLGGAGWLVEEMSAGRLLRGPRGLVVQRLRAATESGSKCVYHGEQGCTVPPERRSAACNYYVCGEALAAAGDEVIAVEAASAAWTAQYQAWEEVLSTEVGGWSGRAEEREEDARLFETLGRRFVELSGPPERG